MRRLGFALSLLAATAAVTRYFAGTRSTLAEVRALRGELRADLETALATAQRLGAAPSVEELDRASERRRGAATQLATLATAWWQGAREPADYLQARGVRGSDHAVDRRALLDDALLQLQLDLKEVPGLSATRLGLIAPSLARSTPLEDAAVAEQLLRAVAVRCLAAPLRQHAPLDVQSATLTIERPDHAVARVTVVGAVDQLIAVLEALGSPSADSPPRRVREFTLRRQEPAEWRLTGPQFATPPALLDATVSLHFPTLREASQ
jgi:hypothetical protein